MRGVAVLVLALFATSAATALPPLNVDGPRFADDQGRTVQLRALNLGSWLMIEPWISGIEWKGGGPLNEAPLYDALTSRFGVEGREALLDAYREHWIAEGDLRRARDLGFNALRVPFSYRILEEDSRPYAYKEGGWRLLDRVVGWCRDLDLYCILDLHRAPGGQTGAGLDEGRLWSDEAYVNRTEALWRAVTLRYKDRPEVAGFDLLNEPIAAPSAGALVRLYDRLYRAVREADPGRILFLEPPFPIGGPEQLPDPGGMGWRSVSYSYHPYATVRGFFPVIGLGWMKWLGLPPWTEARERWQVPVFAGEVNCIGVDGSALPGPLNGDLEACLDDLLGEAEGRGWSWALWTAKYAGGSRGSLWGVSGREAPGKIFPATDSREDLLRKFAERNSTNGFATPPGLERVLGKRLERR